MGALVLAVLDLTLTSRADQIGGVLGTVTGWLARWMDPGVPLITASAAASGTTALQQPPGGSVAAAAMAGVNTAVTNLQGGTTLTLPPGTTRRAPATA